MNDIFVYPGIVDYDDFHTINFIGTIKKKFSVTIYAGTPLLQIIPYKREDVNCIVGPATNHENDLTKKFNSSLPHLYRKLFHKKKNYSLKRG